MRQGLALMLMMAAAPVGAADVVSERARLEGAWRAVEAERDGAAAEAIVGHRLEIMGDRFRISTEGRPLFAGTYALEPAARPARIDLLNDEGEAKGQTWAGIYRLEDGRLSICDNAPDTGKPRPTGFVTSPGSGHVLVVFER